MTATITAPLPIELVSLAETCRILDASLSTVRRLGRTGVLPLRKRGRRTVVRLEDVRAYADRLPAIYGNTK